MIWIVIGVAFVVRVIGINQSLWLDEADNVVAASVNTFFNFVTKYPIGDFHPPGYFALLWLWSYLFGFSEISVRSLSILFGVATVFLTYLIGRKIFNKQAAVIAALLLALSPLHVYYSQEARMYSFAAFSVALSMYFFIKLISQDKWANLGFIVSTILILYSDYVAYLIIPVQLVFLIVTKQKLWRRVLPSFLIAGLGMVPWLLVLPQQITEGSRASTNLPMWKKVAGGADLKNLLLVFVKTIFGRISFDNKLFYGFASALLIALYGGLTFLGIKKLNQWTKLLVGWFFIPLILAILLSNFIPLLSYFRMLFILPAFYLMVAKGVLSLPKVQNKLILTFLILVSLVFLGIYYSNPKFQREDWKGAAGFLSDASKESAIILFEDNHVKYPYLYYQKGQISAYGGLKNIQAKSLEDVNDIEKLLNGKSQIYLFEYLVEITDPQRLLERKIQGLGFTQKDIYNFNGVGFIRFYQR